MSVELADDYDPAAGTPAFGDAAETCGRCGDSLRGRPELAGGGGGDRLRLCRQYVPTGGLWPRARRGNPAFISAGLAGKTVGGHGYYNVRIRANYCNYDASKNETAPVPSSEWAPSVQLALAASSAEVCFEDDFSWISPDSGSALLKTNTDWINTYCTTDTMVRLDILLNEGSVTLNGWGY